MNICGMTFGSVIGVLMLCGTMVGQTPAALPDAPSTTAHEAPPTQPTGPSVVFDTTMGRMVWMYSGAVKRIYQLE